MPDILGLKITELQVSLVFDIILFLFGICCVSIYILIRSVIEVIQQTKLPGGRHLGLNCDHCSGKRYKNGALYLRCRIKPKLVAKLKEIGVIQ